MFRLEWHKRDFAVFSLKAGDSVMPVHNTYLAIYTNLLYTIYINKSIQFFLSVKIITF